MKRDYFSIHAHSEYSNLKVIDSTNRFSRMMDYAWDIGLSGIAMTDHDCISGAIKYIKTYCYEEGDYSVQFKARFELK